MSGVNRSWGGGLLCLFEEKERREKGGEWCTEEPGVTLLGGFSEAMLKCFLENDGQLDPDQVMELDISGQGYQTLAVFDWL